MSSPETAARSSRTTATITAAARRMYPHDALPDDVYARVPAKLAEDAAAAQTIDDGVAALNRNGAFAELPEKEQLTRLNALERTEFFELVRATAAVEVYSDERTWRLCGYEGPSFDKGGYLERGFDDLDWLPDPS